MEEGETYQWLFKPNCKIGVSHIEPLSEVVRQWSTNLKDLLQKLTQTNPEGGLLAEIRYWERLDTILTSVKKEMEAQFVENSLQLLQEEIEDEIQEIRSMMEKLEYAHREA